MREHFFCNDFILLVIKIESHFVSFVAKANVWNPFDARVFEMVILRYMKQLVTLRPGHLSWSLIYAYCDFIVAWVSSSNFFLCDSTGAASSVVAISHDIWFISDVWGMFKLWVDKPQSSSMLHFQEFDCKWGASRYGNSPKQINIKSISCHYIVFNWYLFEPLRIWVNKLWSRFW